MHSIGAKNSKYNDKRKKTTFYHGKPVGADRKDNMSAWDAEASRMKVSTYDELNRLYSYDILRKVFDWSTSFRAGVIIIYRDELSGVRELLLVRERSNRYERDGKLHHRRGPPKGGCSPTDKSALETAVREAREETGIDVLNPSLRARIMPTVFVFRRPKEDNSELICYFIAIFDKKPDVCICKDEIVGYSWEDMSKGLKSILDVSIPTKLLLMSLENTNLSTSDALESSVSLPGES